MDYENEYDIVEDLLSLDRLIENKELCEMIKKEGNLKMEGFLNYLENHPIYTEEEFNEKILENVIEKIDFLNYDKNTKEILCESWKRIIYILKIDNCEIEDFFNLENIFEDENISDFIKEHQYFLEKKQIEIQFELKYDTNGQVTNFLKILKNDVGFKDKKVRKFANNIKQLFYNNEEGIELEPYEINKDGKVFLTTKKIINYFLDIKEDIKINQNLLDLDKSRFPIVDYGRGPLIEELDPTVNDFYNSNQFIDYMNFDCKSLKNNSRRNSFKKSDSKSSFIVIN